MPVVMVKVADKVRRVGCDIYIYIYIVPGQPEFEYKGCHP